MNYYTNQEVKKSERVKGNKEMFVYIAPCFKKEISDDSVWVIQVVNT